MLRSENTRLIIFCAIAVLFVICNALLLLAGRASYVSEQLSPEAANDLIFTSAIFFVVANALIFTASNLLLKPFPIKRKKVLRIFLTLNFLCYLFLLYGVL
jgi:hypothetical protein